MTDEDAGEDAGEDTAMSSDELRNHATVVAALVALPVFIANAWSQNRNRRIQNLSRFTQIHQRLCGDNSDPARKLAAIENDTTRQEAGRLM